MKPPLRHACACVLLAGVCGTANAADRYVSLTGGHVPPFTSWTDAATNIQAAIDAASVGDVVWVTNGIYNAGGKVMAGDLTNRVALDKALTVRSVNGPMATCIEGQWDPISTNGPLAMRCAWLTNGAVITGFSLRNGATRKEGDEVTLQHGGGVWCSSNAVIVTNCIIRQNSAEVMGAGVYSGFLKNCVISNNIKLKPNHQGGGGAAKAILVNCFITGNSAGIGGGVYLSTLTNCAIYRNIASGFGGGSYQSSLDSCTITENSAFSAPFGGAGAYSPGAPSVITRNCILWNNFTKFGNKIALANYSSNGFKTISNCCAYPLPSGSGNVASDPQLVDGVHLGVNSPCRGIGYAPGIVGTDFEDEPWANPPSMGCDEVWESALIGPLSVNLTAASTSVVAYVPLWLTGEVSGRASRIEWSFGDGPVYTNLSAMTSHAWADAGDYTVTFTAYNADNPGGVSTNLLVHVVPVESPQLTPVGLNVTNFILTFPGQAGVTYVVEQATNLSPPVIWQTVQTLVSTGAVMQVTDTKATNAMRFYRVRTQ